MDNIMRRTIDCETSAFNENKKRIDKSKSGMIGRFRDRVSERVTLQEDSEQVILDKRKDQLLPEDEIQREEDYEKRKQLS